MAIHVAILHSRYLRLILAGEKTIESRLSKVAAPPFRAIEPGERLFLKHSGGPFAATAIAGDVQFAQNLTPARVEALRKQYNGRIGGEANYWQNKRASKYATLIHLRDVEPMDVGPTYPRSPYKAWFVLEDSASPLIETTLTDGAIRNHYVRLPAGALPAEETFTLELPDGRTVTSSLTRGRMIRWRGWGPYFANRSMRAGDRVRLVARGPGVYRVSFERSV